MAEISAYQIEMIRKNYIDGIVRISTQGMELKYDTNDLMPLERFRCIEVVKIVDIIKKAEEFFFYKNNFLLDKGKIFVDKKKSIRLIYVPIKGYSCRTMSLEAFIINNIRIRYIRDDILRYKDSGCGSYLRFNIKKIIYSASALVISLLLMAFIHWCFFAAFLVMLAVPVIKIQKKKTIDEPPVDQRTVVLSDREKITVCLSDVFGSEKCICISEYESKYVGRDEKACSIHIHNSAVGRKHAKIYYANGKVTISDNDSINNTFLNNQKLKKNKQYEVKDGDRVVFANEEFMLFIRP